MTMFIAFAKPSSLPPLARQVYVLDKKGVFANPQRPPLAWTTTP
jgi:hypothetical protein